LIFALVSLSYVPRAQRRLLPSVRQAAQVILLDSKVSARGVDSQQTRTSPVLYYWSQTSFEMAFFSRPVGFIHVIQNKWPCDDEFMIVWWVNLSSGKLLHSLFASLLSFAFSNKMQSKICYREEFNRCKIYHMDKICLELGTFEEFAIAVLPRVCYKLWPSASRCLLSCDHFLNHVNETNGTWNNLKKSHFKRCLGSIVC